MNVTQEPIDDRCMIGACVDDVNLDVKAKVSYVTHIQVTYMSG